MAKERKKSNKLIEISEGIVLLVLLLSYFPLPRKGSRYVKYQFLCQKVGIRYDFTLLYNQQTKRI